MNNSEKEFTDILIKGFNFYNVETSGEQIKKMAEYNSMVMQANEHTNLTAIKDGKESAQKHFLDSANPQALKIISEAKNVIDIGSGAGFPGIVLAVMKPEVNFTLVDTRKKRCEFMESVKTHLGLSNVSIVWGRAEELGKMPLYREKFDAACARALAAMPVLLEYLAPFVKLGGCAMLYKGSIVDEEIAASETAASLLGFSSFTKLSYKLPEDGADLAVIKVVKYAETPSKYPRKPGIALKRPL